MSLATTDIPDINTVPKPALALPHTTGINSVLRHKLVDGFLVLNIEEKKVIRNDTEIKNLSPFQFCVLAILMRNPIVIGHQELHEAAISLGRQIYKGNMAIPRSSRDTRIPPPVGRMFKEVGIYHDIFHTTRQVIRHLRDTLGEPNIIGTYPGEGFRLDDEVTVIHPYNGHWRPKKQRRTAPLNAARL